MVAVAMEDPPDEELAAWLARFTQADVAWLGQAILDGWLDDSPAEPLTACGKAARAVRRARAELEALPHPGFCAWTELDVILRRLYEAGADDMTAAAFSAVESALNAEQS